MSVLPHSAAQHDDARRTAQPRWLIYALGGGMGHLMRSLSLAREANRRGISVRILSNSPFAPQIANRRRSSLVAISNEIEIVCITSEAQKEEVTREVSHAIQATGPIAAFIVDTFPRGLAGELVAWLGNIQATKVWVQRDLNPHYVRWGGVEGIVCQYDLIFAPGESGALANLPQLVNTAPWLICDSSEMLPFSQSREVLGITADDDTFLAVVSGCGKAEEALQAANMAQALAAIVGESHVRFVSCDQPANTAAREIACSVWPLLPTMNGVDLLIGAGGYNTIHEARSAGVPLLAVPQPRLYDRQQQRISAQELAASWEHARELAVEQIRTRVSRRRDVEATFSNGVYAAVARILELQRSRTN